MKKILILLFALATVFTLSPRVKALSPTTEVHVHYFRYAGDYTNWNVWMWQFEPDSKGDDPSFPGHPFVLDDSPEEYNFGGVVSKISLNSEVLSGATTIGILIRRGNWLEKDIDQDRTIAVPATSPNGIFHVYLVEGDFRMGTSVNDPNGPNRDPKFFQAFFTSNNTIYFRATEEMTPANLSLKAGEEEVAITDVTVTNRTGVITIDGVIDYGKVYTLSGVFTGAVTNDFVVTFDGVYDSEEFEAAFGYAGDDLGAIPSATKTTFRVWAPVSTTVYLNLYNTGTPASLGGTNDPTKTVEMTKSEKGTFYWEEAGNLHGTYYTYTVVNQSRTSELVDPYAKSVGINGLRGLVVDFSQVNPDGFTYNTRPDNMTNATDAIIYELHVRDLTSHSSWNGSEVNRGRFLGLIEQGTRYQGVKTGFDHIVDLGVTHVQLLPFFDFGYLDESRINTDGYNSFNWGYMPINFNALEGAYSANPFDGLLRIQEMKQVIMAFTDANIRINMDVVYNHHGLTADSNFEMLVPGYYFRKNAQGAFSNGSGTGNETASERIMMRKFMLDSIAFWTHEYNISGYRFDLMALHDIETMNQIVDLVRSIDPTIMIYGEPWMGGTSPLPASMQAGKGNLYQMPYVGAFNDDFRDAVKGSVFNREEGGYVQGLFTMQNTTRIKYGIVGGIEYEGISKSLLSHTGRHWHTEPIKTVNYVTAHDNNTLHDKLYQTLERYNRLDLIPAMSKQSNAMVFTSQGIAFLHAGDEFLRSKPLIDRDGFDHNSYQSPDETNQMRWDELATELGTSMNEYYKGLIALRKAQPTLRLASAQEVRDSLTFVHENVTGLIAYTIKNNTFEEGNDTLFIAHNANSKNVRIKLPTGGGWVQIVNGEQAGLEPIETFKGGATLTIPAHTSVVLYQDTTIADTNPTPIIVASTAGGVFVIGGVLFFLKKKKLWFFK